MIEVGEDTMDRLHTLLQGIEGAKGKVLRPAFGRALQAGKTEARKQAVSTYQIKTGDFNKNTRIRYDGINDDPDEIRGSITFAGRPIKLVKYNVSPKKMTGRNIIPKANVLRANSPVTFNRKNDVFIQQMETGHTGIYRREETGKIRELYAPSGPKMVENPEVMEAITDRVDEVLSKRIDYEMERLLGRSGGQE